MTRLGVQDFDIAALMEVCAHWPVGPVPVQAAQDPLLERVRQVLLSLAQTSTTAPGADLIALKDLVEAGKLTPVIDGTYPLRDTPKAVGHVADGHARGTVVISMTQPAGSTA